MNDLIMQIRQTDSQIDNIVPLLVADDYQEVAQFIQDIFGRLTNIFQNIIQIPGIAERIDIQSYMKSLECFVYAIHAMDTIQIADILLYEVRGMFHGIYEMCEGGDLDA